MRATALLISMLLLTAPPLVWGSDIAAPVIAASHVTELCNKLIINANDIGILLSSIADHDSAETAAPQLEEKFAAMKALLSDLEQLPFDAETTHIIAGRMITLTHITQCQIPKIQELLRLNAYDSDSLMNHLLSYRIAQNLYDDGSRGSERTYSVIDEDLTESFCDTVCVLRQITGVQTGKAAVPIVGKPLAAYRKFKEELILRRSSGTHPQIIFLKQEPLIVLADKIQREQERLKNHVFYKDSELPGILRKFIQIIH